MARKLSKRVLRLRELLDERGIAHFVNHDGLTGQWEITIIQPDQQPKPITQIIHPKSLVCDQDWLDKEVIS